MSAATVADFLRIKPKVWNFPKRLLNFNIVAIEMKI
jgi:hypothetical protein